MGFGPPRAAWYLAELVIELRVEGDSRRVVHTSTVLLWGRTREEAYQKALRRGAQENRSHTNPEGKLVEMRFRGLGNLLEVLDPLEDGAELCFSEEVGVSEEDMARRVRPRESLDLFAARPSYAGPDYSSGAVLQDAVQEALDASIELALQDAMGGE